MVTEFPSTPHEALNRPVNFTKQEGVADRRRILSAGRLRLKNIWNCVPHLMWLGRRWTHWSVEGWCVGDKSIAAETWASWQGPRLYYLVWWWDVRASVEKSHCSFNLAYNFHETDGLHTCSDHECLGHPNFRPCSKWKPSAAPFASMTKVVMANWSWF